jgi:O-antigen ligase
VSAKLATLFLTAFAMWLLWKERKHAKGLSMAVWAPVLWAFIIGSKPISLWLGLSEDTGSQTYVEDLLIDKVLYLALIVAATIVLLRRRIKWGSTLSDNSWLLVFFLYLFISIGWSDEPLSSFKRWVKDFGNVLMVLVLLSEKDPTQAVRAFFARCAFVFVPISLLVIKYYPAISMHYSRYDGRALFVGISTNKNIFGMTMYVCSVVLIWLFIEARKPEFRKRDKLAWVRYGLVLLMTAWLEKKAESSTALVCTLLGGGIIFAIRMASFRRVIRHLGTIAGVAIGSVVVLQATGLWDALAASFAAAVGRDPTFHGRKEIWAALLQQDINPILGVGYYSFWSPERILKISQGYSYQLNEAHNGYLETYLNSGVVGLFLLLAVIVVAANRIKREMLAGVSLGAVRFAFLLAAIFYGMSEAIFNRLSLVWFVLLLAVLVPPRMRLKKQTIDLEATEPLKFSHGVQGA